MTNAWCMSIHTIKKHLFNGKQSTKNCFLGKLFPMSEKWYKNGLVFSCTGCGGCCTGSPGYVWLTQKDILRLSTHLNMSESAFLQQYCVYAKGRYSLRDIPPDYSCIFLRDKVRCGVYDARPTQCRKFPWWKEVLSSEREWNQTSRYCEGINHPDGKKYSQEEIDQFHADEYSPD